MGEFFERLLHVLFAVVKWISGIIISGILLLSLVAYFTQLPSPKALPSQPYPESRYLTVDGFQIHTRIWEPSGSSRGSVLLVHGFYGSTYSWEQTARALQQLGYYTVAVDIPGFGYSSRSRAVDHSSEGRAELLWSLVDQLPSSSSPWILLGHSMGGEIVVRMTSLQPFRVSSLVLIAPALSRPSSDAQRIIINSVLFIPPLERWGAILAHYRFLGRESIKSTLTSAYGRKPTFEELDGYLKPVQLPGTEWSAMDLIRAEPSKPVKLSSISTRTLIISGAKDSWIDPLESEKSAGLFVNARYVEIPDAYHVPMETAFNETFEPISEFLISENIPR